MEKYFNPDNEVPPFKVYIKKEDPMLENLLEYYRKSDGAKKKKKVEENQSEFESECEKTERVCLLKLSLSLFFGTTNYQKLQPDN